MNEGKQPGIIHFIAGITLKQMIAISAAIHLIVMIITSASPWLWHKRRAVFNPIEVTLVAAPPNELPSLTTKESQNVASQETEKAVPLKEQAPPKKEELVEPSKKKSKPVKEKDTSQEDLKKALDMARQMSRKEGPERKAGPNLELPSAGKEGSTIAQAAPGTEFDAYKFRIKTRIITSWVCPPDLREEKNISAVLYMRLDYEGNVIDSTVQQSSGNQYFDESAIRALKKASPFGPPPEGDREVLFREGIELLFQPAAEENP
jgi:TonB family protein